MMQEKRRVHFIGIGGVGMSGLASIDLARGLHVSGSDPQQNAATERLAASAAAIHTEQVPANIEIEPRDLVVWTAAIQDDNPELQAAKNAGIPIMSRADYLGRLMAEHSGPRIAVTGTHGKTTTTSMIASVLLGGGLDPNVLVGAEFSGIGGNVRVGLGNIFLAEACEAYDSFLSLKPDIAVITNIEADHLDYYGNEERVFQSFDRFVRGMPNTGLLIAGGDDPGIQRLLTGLADFSIRRATYGLNSPSSGIAAGSVRSSPAGQQFEVFRAESGTRSLLGSVDLPIPGIHGVQNALAAVTVGLELGISFGDIKKALAEFRGAERRFELLAEIDGITVIDDYAHHPTE